MISFRAMSSVSLLALLVTLAGCSAESGTAGGADTTNTVRAKDSVAAVDQSAGIEGAARGPMRGGPPGGPDFLLVAALHEPINLTADQKTAIEGALAANKPSAPPAFDKTRVSALAAGIRAGKVDPSTVKAPSQDGMAARQAASAKALATLHATLTPEQRTALVAAVTKHAAEHGPKDGPREGGKDGARPPHMERAGGQRPGPMGGMLEGLDLSKTQEDAIRAKLDAQRPAPPSEADRAAMKTQHDAFRTAMQAKLQTFATDSFDATAFVTPPAGAMKGGPGEHADRFASDLAIITSVLEPAQREKLAARIEAGPPAPMARPAPAR